ncbi:hypothetical protein SAMN05192549_106198 [Duganella sacchari]|uniref:Lipoprotein n=1 Tax=Duganella sacchari TaxID=551987 RepID=A0A1M7Q4X8_9BURK|nr:hypothetical protein [Duganella sacchari]SHN25306.1 hypothetical protein SAMN05192549_106198 [Duganella sacchari]
MKHLPLYVLALSATMAACSPHEPPAAPPAPVASAPAAASAVKVPDAAKAREVALMKAVFGDRYDAQKHQALAEIEVDGAEATHLMTLNGSTDLADGRTVMVVNGAMSDDDGKDITAHVSSGVLNVYVLRREGSSWKVLERREGVDTLGSEGQIGAVKWVTLGAGKPGFIVSNGGIWQGYWIQHAAIYELSAGVRSLGSFEEGSGNEGACGPNTSECWDTQGSIRFAQEPQQSGYSDIVVDFKDKRYTVTEGKDGSFVEQVQSDTRSTARYHFDGKAYVLAAGTNPVQGI